MGLLYNRFLIFNEEGEDQQNPPQQDKSQDQPTDYTQQDQEYQDTDNQDQTKISSKMINSLPMINLRTIRRKIRHGEIMTTKMTAKNRTRILLLQIQKNRL